jgi:hypothetical protein
MYLISRLDLARANSVPARPAKSLIIVCVKLLFDCIEPNNETKEPNKSLLLWLERNCTRWADCCEYEYKDYYRSLKGASSSGSSQYQFQPQGFCSASNTQKFYL